MNPATAALRYAARWPVLPLHAPDPAAPTGVDRDGNATGSCTCRDPECGSAGKHPRILGGCNAATTDETEIRRWGRRYGGRWNVGIRTGSGLAVLDVDPGRDGDSSLAELEEEHGPLETLTVETGGGGLHLYFTTPEPVRCRVSFRPGLDTRGVGGYVVAPPSLHPSGRRWTWRPDVRRIAPMPAWLLAMVNPPRREPQNMSSDGQFSSRYIAAAIERECAEMAATAPGGRNDRLNVAAFNLARFVASGDAELDPVLRALAAAAVHVGLGEREIEATLVSAFGARGVPL